MSRNYRRRNSIQATFKDYLVPIIWGVFILILLYSFFSWNTTDTSMENWWENRIPAEISFWDTNAEAFIEYPGNIQEKITGDSKLYKWEKIIVKEWTIALSMPDGNSISLNKIAELTYNQDGKYALYFSDGWFTLSTDTNISMSYANIDAPAGSIIALTQNEASSTVYVISWSAKVTNLVWVSTLVIEWEKVSVSRKNSRNEDIDLSSEKSNIDSYFKWSDWFLENNGHILLNQNTSTSTPESSSWSLWSRGKYIAFDTLSDEINVNSNTIDITGTILSDSVWSLTIDGKQANISPSLNTFSLNGFTLPGRANDVVIKIYNTKKDILEKDVFTIYAPWSTNNSSTSNATFNNITTYEVDATEFYFTAPSTSGKFSTTGSEITIRWGTRTKWISKVQVNGFTLSSFNGTTWRYHAFERFETLEIGTNQYKIDYFWENGNIVYTDYFTIVKKTSTATTPTVVPLSNEEKTISWEANTTE